MAGFELGFWNAWLMSVPFLALVACMVGRKRDVIKRMSDMTGYSGREKLFTVSASLSPYLFTLATIWAPFTSSLLLVFLGLLVYALGMAMLVASLKAFIGTPLGEPFATGPYLFSRNPMYVGATAVLFGICLATANFGLFVYVAVATFLQHFMILAEERICKMKFGASFVQYTERVPRYLLFV
jgi:protein-S-isoprenylcysteine O-methyltransferase Ste14